jgi:DNA primase
LERFDRLFAKPLRPDFQPRKSFKPIRSTTREAKNIGSQGSDLLVRGVLAALLSDPRQISRHHEALSAFVPRDPSHARLLSAMLNGIWDAESAKETLDTTALLTILGSDLYNMAQLLLSGDGSAFAFMRPDLGGEAGFSAGEAAIGLDEAIRLMCERPQLEAALMRATEAASMDLTDESFARQQALRAEKDNFDRRLAALFQRDDAF